VGAAQLLAKRHGIIPGRRVLLAGSGPCCCSGRPAGRATAPRLWGLLEATRPAAWLRHGPSRVGQLGSPERGRHYVSALRTAQHPLPFWAGPSAGGGGDRVMRRCHAIGRPGQPDPRHGRTSPGGRAVVGFGLAPNISWRSLLGAPLLRAGVRCWVPRLDQKGPDDRASLFVARRGCQYCRCWRGHAGRQIGCFGSRLASGSSDSDGFGTRAGDLRLANAVQISRFGVMLNTLFGPPGLSAITRIDTPICRCEK